jgi:hypothetical protein
MMMDPATIKDLHTAAVILAVIGVILSIIYFGFKLAFPRKIQPHEYDNAESWGSQDLDSRKMRKTKK